MKAATLKKFCRTCLASFPAEGFVDINSVMQNDDAKDNAEREFNRKYYNKGENSVTYLQCLLKCTDLQDHAGLPKLICMQCSRVLRLIHEYSYNARRADELLRSKQRWKRSRQSRQNQPSPPTEAQTQKAPSDAIRSGSVIRFRCKICQQNLESRLALKAHIKSHLDIISYKCELCDYSSRKRSLLSKHYTNEHGVEASREQLRSHIDSSGDAEMNSSLQLESEPAEDVKEEVQSVNQYASFEPKQFQNQFESYMSTTELERKRQEIVERQLEEVERKLGKRGKNEEQSVSGNENQSIERNDSGQCHMGLNESSNSLLSLGNSLYEIDVGESDAGGLLNQQQVFDETMPNEMDINNDFVLGPDVTIEPLSDQNVIIQYVDTGDGNMILENNYIDLGNGLLQLNPSLSDAPKPLAQFSTHQPNAKKPDHKMGVKTFFSEEDTGVSRVSIAKPRLQAKGLVSRRASLAVCGEKQIELRKRKLPQIDASDNSNKRILSEFHRTTCKICSDVFQTQTELKSHMLTHNEIPHFFCGHCSFYTFYKIDLTQHYKVQHNCLPSQEQLQPTNRFEANEKPKPTLVDNNSGSASYSNSHGNSVGTNNPRAIFKCDLCFFVSRSKLTLRTHYKQKHEFEALEVHLRPTIDNSKLEMNSVPLREKKNYPGGNNAKRLSAKFMRGQQQHSQQQQKQYHQKQQQYQQQHQQYKRHQHQLVEVLSHQIGPEQGVQGAVLETTTGISSVNYIAGHNSINSTATHIDTTGVNGGLVTETMDISNVNSATSNTFNEPMANTAVGFEVLESGGAINFPPDAVIQVCVASEGTATTASLVNNEIHDIFLDACIPSTTASLQAAGLTQAMPTDTVPQIVASEQTIEHNMVLDFFEDFDVDVDVENVNDVDPANDDRDGLVLTSDEEYEELSKFTVSDVVGEAAIASGLGALTQPTVKQPEICCDLCNKRFYTYYQYENHLFLHRGLAPYRCELCTNLYNTKKNLIRHYRAIHKRVPSRDMLQAKGEKALLENTAQPLIEHLDLENLPPSTFMCGKCMYESYDHDSVMSHLTSVHGITDEKFMLKKLPYECPRCIRSFDTKPHLIRHLERSHLIDTVIQHLAMGYENERPEVLQQPGIVGNYSSEDFTEDLPTRDHQTHLQNFQTVNNSTMSSFCTELRAGNNGSTNFNNNNNNNDINSNNNPNYYNNNNNSLANNNQLAMATPKAGILVDGSEFKFSEMPTTKLTQETAGVQTPSTLCTTGLLAGNIESLAMAPNAKNVLESNHHQYPIQQQQHFHHHNDNNTSGYNNNNNNNRHQYRRQNRLQSNYHLPPFLNYDNNNGSDEYDRQMEELLMFSDQNQQQQQRQQLNNEILYQPSNEPSSAVDGFSKRRKTNKTSKNEAAQAQLDPEELKNEEIKCEIDYEEFLGASSIILPLKREASCAEIKIPTVTPARATSKAAATLVPATPTPTPTTVTSTTGSATASSRNDMESKFVCSICNGKYKTILLLRWHMKRHLDRSFRCDQCPKSYAYKNELTNHKKVHASELPFACDACEKRFGYAHHLKRHRDVAHFGKRRECPMPTCDRKFTSTAQLNLHILKHNKVPVPYKCKYCSAEFQLRKRFREHVSKAHQICMEEKEIAEVFRRNAGYTNRHDFPVAVSGGRMVRRLDVEADALGVQNTAKSLADDNEPLKSTISLRDETLKMNALVETHFDISQTFADGSGEHLAEFL